VQAAEDAWNTRNPEQVALAYTEDSEWRNRSEFFSGRAAIKEFLQRKWKKRTGLPLKERTLRHKHNMVLAIPLGVRQALIQFRHVIFSYGYWLIKPLWELLYARSAQS
jgi:hypothetical protein